MSLIGALIGAGVGLASTGAQAAQQKRQREEASARNVADTLYSPWLQSQQEQLPAGPSAGAIAQGTMGGFRQGGALSSALKSDDWSMGQKKKSAYEE